MADACAACSSSRVGDRSAAPERISTVWDNSAVLLPTRPVEPTNRPIHSGAGRRLACEQEASLVVISRAGVDVALNEAEARPITGDGAWSGQRLRQAAAHPVWASRQALAVLRARSQLRACQRLGPRARIFGRCHVVNFSMIEVGERLLMYGDPVRCDLNAHGGGRLEIGNGVFINFGTSISAHTLVRIGDGCLIGQYSIILDCDYHDPAGSGGHGLPRPIVIGDRVWMGARVTVLKGVTIGSGSVIGAGSVVTRDIPPGVLAAGVPAAVIKTL